MKALWSLRGLFARQAGGLLTALLLSLVALAAGVALLGTSGWFLTAAALTTLGLGFNLFAPSALVRGFSFIRILARYGERLSGHDATLRLLADLRGWLFAKLFPRFPLADKSLRHGDLVSRLTADVDALDTAFLVAIGPITAAMVIGITLTVVLGLLLPAAAPAYGIAFALATLAVPGLLLMAGRRTSTQMVERAAAARMAVLDGLDGHADLVTFGVLGTAQAGFDGKAIALANARKRLGSLVSIASCMVQVLAAGALIGTLWFGLLAHQQEQVDGPLLVGLLLAVLASFEATGAIVRSVGKLGGAMAAAERLVALTETVPGVIDPLEPKALPRTGVIAMSGVTYCYGGGPPALRDVDLSIAPGERVAIVGPSGAGKSSLLRLLLRLADPQGGRISIGGVALDGLRQGDIHAHMALLSQDSPVFNESIRANLLIGRADADEPALWAALDAARIGDFVRGLPRRLDTPLGENGRTVSAGQGRRLCLARVLLAHAPVLLLDEPTNGLDRETELAFFETLKVATAGRTVVLVTHAELPAGTVDRVVTLRHGEVV